MTAIAISRIHFPVTRLGPGRRIGIWLQGCSIRCPGCISADTWAADRGATTVEVVMAAIAAWLPAADGITVSGGEPFDQPEALAALLTALRLRSAADIFVYTGHPFAAVAGALAGMPGLIDAVMSDPFDLAAPQTLALRGSDNQRLHLLTALGRERFAAYDRPVEAHDLGVDLMLDDEGTVWLAGIPARDDLHRLQAVLEAAGHRLATSVDRGVGRARAPVRSGLDR